MDSYMQGSISPNGMMLPQNTGVVFRSTSVYYGGVGVSAAAYSGGAEKVYASANGAVAVAPAVVSYTGSFAVADREVSQGILAQAFAEEESAGSAVWYANARSNGRPTTPAIGNDNPVGDVLLPLLACAAVYAIVRSFKSIVYQLRKPDRV